MQALVAQWLEQHPYKMLAVGSIPTRGTSSHKLRDIVQFADRALSSAVEQLVYTE